MPHEGWGVPAQEEQVIRHHQHHLCFEVCTVCLRGISNPRLVALTPHWEQLQGFTGDGATCTNVTLVPRFSLPPAGSASLGGFL